MEASAPLPIRHHAVISGTGRAGTTFLVQLLTHLGLDTGFAVADLELFAHARAGLESDIRTPDAPYIVKSPWFCDYADEVFARPDITVDHLFIPMRDLFSAAESRRFVVRSASAELAISDRENLDGSTVSGGLWHTSDPSKQEEVLQAQFYRLLLAASLTNTPVTLINYPLLTLDSEYLFKKLSPVLGDIEQSFFQQQHRAVVKPDWVHDFTTGG